MERIAANRLDRSFYKYQEEFEEAALSVLRSGWYVLGPRVEKFENEFAGYTGAKYAVGVASGLDALILAFRVLGIGVGDEVIVPGNTYIASVMGVTINGATPVFAEPDEFYNIDASKIEAAITEKTKAVLIVHLYGQACEADRICEICKKHNLRLVEDCAQSHGAKYNDRMTGTFGDIGCFSFYPSKNLGAFGDGGAVVTDDEKIAADLKMLRNYGSRKRYYFEEVGMNSRLDEMQAALLSVRLKHLDELNEERKEIAKRYLEGIHNESILIPSVRKDATSVWHQFVIRTERRKELIKYLEEKEIGSIIHYPIPPHLSECYKALGHKAGDFPITEKYANEVLSLPFYNGMTEEEEEYVIEALNAF
ncbi:MAG: DegT/DnrJ/EryC1/StrS family aminotransferase [Lachnospiraceae bacterium]|nr:DegT/DnrJ/EryC1/StrS family aminotransferase [Lachnospiraceae bacterium]